MGIVYLWDSVSQVYYKKLLENKFAERELRCGGTPDGSFIRTMRRHATPSQVKLYLAQYRTTGFEHSPFSLVLAPLIFFLFSNTKYVQKESRLESTNAVKEKATELMRSLSPDDLQHCFWQWKTRMEQCRNRGGE